MLTKEHLKFRVRSGKVKPVFLAEGDPAALALATDMAALMADAEGMRVGEVEEALEALGDDAVAPAFRKLLLDGCDAADDDGKVEAARWAALKGAQELRMQGALPADAMRDGLYSDLPACRVVTAVKQVAPGSLLHRYNLSQVQGLLLRARSVTVSTTTTDIAERRELFRQLRFHRLMGEVADAKGRLTIVLSGPLGIFDQAATYGLRLANFFPHVVHLSTWRVEAEVHIKNKTLDLVLDESSGLKSHYRHNVPFIPEELLAFVGSFNERAAGWSVAPGAEFVHIGRESYCFPDLTISGQDGARVHVELFHRWHATQLEHRLQALESSKFSGLLLGVSKNLARTADGGARLAESAWFAKYGFIFSDFPTPKALLTRLATYGKV